MYLSHISILRQQTVSHYFKKRISQCYERINTNLIYWETMNKEFKYCSLNCSRRILRINEMERLNNSSLRDLQVSYVILHIYGLTMNQIKYRLPFTSSINGVLQLLYADFHFQNALAFIYFTNFGNMILILLTLGSTPSSHSLFKLFANVIYF